MSHERHERDPETTQLIAYLRGGVTPMTYMGRDGTVLQINDWGLKNLGLMRDEVLGHSIFALLPSMADAIRERIEHVFQTGQPLVVEDDLLLPAGLQHFKSTVSPVFDDAGRVVAVQSQSWEVTAEYEVANSLRRADHKLAVIFEHSPYRILTFATGGIVTYVNRVGPGFTGEGLIGRDSHHFVLPEFHAAYDEALKCVFEGRQASRLEFSDVGGTWWEATLVPVIHEGCVEQGISFSVDITEKRRAEGEKIRFHAQMQHAQKLESLGVLAGGIAHDFNNLLMAIVGNTDLALAKLPCDAAAKEYLEDVMTAAERAADLCRQMLAYAGRGQLVVEPVDLSRLVAEMAPSVGVSISNGVELTRDLAAGLPTIEADPSQLRQVLLSLINNASEAIGDLKGAIFIGTRRERLEGSDLSGAQLTDGLEPGEYLVLEVRDTGSGIDDATRARMFEPFFSTKASGRGLGLSATLGTIRRHRGAILVDSTVGVGTRVRVVFPFAVGEAQRAMRRAVSTAPQGHGLILVVDDEEGVRKVAMKALSRHGYEVSTANDGREALARYGEHGQRIRLVLLDLTMPGFSGEQTLRALRDRSPDLPIIIMSGYSESALKDDSVRFLPKPFRLDELIKAVEEALATPAEI